MLQNARGFSYYRAPWLIYFPGLCITATVLCVNVLADRLQERADPRRAGGATPTTHGLPGGGSS
jgi:ABC-type dipeptide/oligopeptide/nickel transport system permease subunit